MTRLYFACALRIFTSTTMVLAILVEVTYPIFSFRCESVLRACAPVVCSAIYKLSPHPTCAGARRLLLRFTCLLCCSLLFRSSGCFFAGRRFHAGRGFFGRRSGRLLVFGRRLSGFCRSHLPCWS